VRRDLRQDARLVRAALDYVGVQVLREQHLHGDGVAAVLPCVDLAEGPGPQQPLALPVQAQVGEVQQLDGALMRDVVDLLGQLLRFREPNLHAQQRPLQLVVVAPRTPGEHTPRRAAQAGEGARYTPASAVSSGPGPSATILVTRSAVPQQRLLRAVASASLNGRHQGIPQPAVLQVVAAAAGAVAAAALALSAAAAPVALPAALAEAAVAVPALLRLPAPAAAGVTAALPAGAI
jgi:hypothetical protein